MSIDRFTRLYNLYTKKKNMLIRSSIRVCLLVLLIGISSITYAQTVGGMLPSDDFDGDGIINSIDLDDDNDGVLDVVENAWCKPLTGNKIIPVGKTYGVTAASFGSYLPAVTAGLDATTCMSPGQVTTLTYDFGKTVKNPIIGFYGVDFAKEEWFDLNDNPVQLRILDASDPTIVSNNILTLSTNPVAGANTAATSAMGRVQVFGNVTGLKVKHTWLLTASNCDNHGFSFIEPTECLDGPNPDTDNDGIINSLDLDSDGDGCSDALEAGTTTSTTANFKFTGSNASFGANGFYNALEKTAAESNLYNGIYTYDYANNAGYNSCTDTDGDGVPDLIDLDNDNDGVLDAVESPTCFYTLDDLARPASVSSDLTQHTASYVIGNSIDGVGSTASAFATGQDWVGKEIFKFTANNYITIAGMSFDLVNWALSSATASTFKLQGSGDNVNWIDLSTATYSTATTGTFTISNTLATTSKLKYYRLVGVAGTSGYGGVYEARFNLPAATSSSANPKSSCSNDTDGDGIFNQNDLDSDGDGCPDAVEAGTTAIATSGVLSSSKLTTSVIPAPYGANGFANGLETSTESGKYTGTYTYIYAINASTNACLDSDGDGVTDVLDLDDDNDGVLDTTEQTNCITYGFDLNTLTFNGSSITGKIVNSFNTAGGDVWKSSYSNENL